MQTENCECLLFGHNFADVKAREWYKTSQRFTFVILWQRRCFVTESSRASSTSIRIFLKKTTNNTRPHKNVKERNMIASLTEHALYDVWHHCIRKTLFSFVHTNDTPAIQKKAPLWGPFSKIWVSGAWKRCSRIDKMLKRRKKISVFIYIWIRVDGT